jgi:hypothetical protein
MLIIISDNSAKLASVKETSLGCILCILDFSREMLKICDYIFAIKIENSGVAYIFILFEE